MFEAILGMGLFGIVLVALIWILPIILILRSNKTNGGEKLVWILLIFFFSWLSWILYALVAPISNKN